MYSTATHGSWCNTRTYPTQCPRCTSQVFFFQCDHESRVFFDHLDQPWPIHDCFLRRMSRRSAAAPPRPSGKRAWDTLVDVFESKESKESGLLTGMKRYPGGIDVASVSRKPSSESGQSPAQTQAIHPIGNSQPEYLSGIVHDVNHLSLLDKLGIGPDTVGAGIIRQTFPELEVVQITVLVNDSEAEDMLSYTAWFRPTDVAESLARGHFVSAAFRAENILIAGRRWIGEDLERIL